MDFEQLVGKVGGRFEWEQGEMGNYAFWKIQEKVLSNHIGRYCREQTEG